MLLYNELYLPKDENKKLTIKNLKKASEIKTKRITFFADSDIGCGLNIYICKKESLTPYEAFIALWLKHTLWEEEIDDFDFSEESCLKIYENIFLNTLEGYDLKEINPKNSLKYIIKKIKDETTKIKPIKNKTDEIGFLDVSGIYINKKITDKMPVILNRNDNPILCTELCANNEFGDYRELFIETEQKYIYFL